MKTLLLLCTLIASSSLGEILSAKGMQQVGDVILRPRALTRAIARMMRNAYLWVGVACLAVSFFSFISLLSYADLSFVVPLTAVGYITNTIGARFFLRERIARARWLGTLLVAGGVALIALDQHIAALFRAPLGGWLRQFYLTLTPQGYWISQTDAPVMFWLLFAMRLTLLLCVVGALVYYVIALVAALWWFVDRRRQRALGLSYTPPVTILIPVRGADTEAYHNFASFCRQDYPEHQIVFGVRGEDDLAVPVIRRLIADFPDRDIELVISANEIGYNAKVSNLQNMYARAKHDLLLIADSDIRVGPNYLRRVVAPLKQQRVGMVTCLYRGANAQTIGALLENIGISSTFGADVCSARLLDGIKFALGSTIVTRRDLLERMGGFPALADYLADDFLFGHYVAAEGYEVVLSDCVVDHISGPDTFGAMLKHQLRWGRSMRISRPWGYRGLILTYGTATSLLALLAWNFASFAWWLLGVTIFVRALPAFVVGVIGMKDYVLARWFWLVPVRDLITFVVWVVSFGGDEIEWRGRSFRVLPSGKLAPVGKA